MAALSGTINGTATRVVARLGNAADIPALITGEIGYDVDFRVFRVGDDTSTPPRIPTTKSTGPFDFSISGAWTFSEIDIVEGGTVDGVDISALNAANGFIVRKANNSFGQVSITSGDGSLTVTNGNGVNGDVDVRVSAAIMEALTAGYIKEVVSSSKFTGKGINGSPLDIKQASETQVGALRIATPIETGAGGLHTVALTPYSMMNMAPDSQLAIYLRGIFQTAFSITTTTSFTGNGNGGSPLTLAQATEELRGGMTVATQGEVNLGTSDTDALTPKKLKGLQPGSDTANALAAALGISLPLSITNLKMTGPGVLGRNNATPDQAVGVLPFATKPKVIEGLTANDFDIVNQAALKAFFPFGTVKTEPYAANALPDPAQAGKGAVTYNDTLRSMQVSSGTAWQDINNLSPYQSLWKKVSTVTYTGTTPRALVFDPGDRIMIGAPTSGPGADENDVDINIGGNWISLIDTVSILGILTLGRIVEVCSPNNQNCLITWASSTLGIGFGSGIELKLWFGPSSRNMLTNLGVWTNKQVRGRTSGSTFRITRFRPLSDELITTPPAA